VGVENKTDDALSRRVMILVPMSTKVIRFERLEEEYESVPILEKYIPHYRTCLLERRAVFFYITDI